MKRYPRTREWLEVTLIEAYLEPEALWSLTFVDRRERAIFCTANRQHVELDEPGRPIDPALDERLHRFEAGDAHLLVVPRMPTEERERHMDAFSMADPTFDARQRAMRVSWDDHWRPGSFRALARDLPIEAAWLERIHVPARAAIARFAEEHRLAADGFVHLVFD